MTDHPVTPDREALEEALIPRLGQYEALKAVNAVLPLLTDALDRARQQGRDEVQEIFDRMWADPDWEGQVSMGFASTFAQEVDEPTSRSGQ